MASLSGRDDEFDWFWGSLKPWQILHSTLAARERNGSNQLQDVWEHVNEALMTASTANKPMKREIDDEPEPRGSASATRALGMRFLAHHDGEFWRQGGVMESRVRDWLISSNSSDIEQQRPAPALLPSSSSPRDENLHRHHSASTSFGLHARRTQTSAGFTTPVLQCQESLLESRSAGGGIRRRGYRQSDYEGSEAEAGEQGGDEDGGIDAGNARDSRLVVNRYCAGGGWGGGAIAGAAAEAEVGEEMEEVCAVCLEKLEEEEEEEEEQGSLQVLACQHLFHKACIAPWLERQPHARCPCCRAPIILAGSAPLNLAADLAAPARPGRCPGCLHHRQHDIMGLVADIEAVLQQLGLRD